MTQILTAKSMRVTLVLDPAEVARLEAPDGKPRVALAIRLPDRRVSAALADRGAPALELRPELRMHREALGQRQERVRERHELLVRRRVSVDLSAKSVRKAIVAIREHGPDNVAAIIQGKLAGDTTTEAGLVAQAKVKPPEVVS